MNWFEKVLNSDAGKIARDRAEELVRKAEEGLAGADSGLPVPDGDEGFSSAADDADG